MHRPRLVRRAVLWSHSSVFPLSRHDLLQPAMYKQTILIPPCSLTICMFLQLHVVFPFHFVLSLVYPTCSLYPPRPYAFPSVLVAWSSAHLSLVSTRLISAVLSPLLQCSRKLSILSVFLFFSITRGLRYRIFILSYLEACARLFLLLGNSAQIRRVFESLTPPHSSIVNLDF